MKTQNTFCNSVTGKCDCGSNGFWNSSKCLYCPTNWVLLRNSCFFGSSASIAFSSLSPSLIYNYCYNQSSAQIATLINTDSKLLIFQNNLLAFPQNNYFFNAYRIGATQTYQSGSNTLSVMTPYWNGTANYNCTYLNINSSYFVSSPCNLNQYFMCQISM